MLFAATALVFGCKEEKEPEPAIPVLTVGQSELSFEQNGGTATVSVTSNRPWSISTDADWLAFNPSSGGASDAPVSVTVTALSNNSNDRTSSFKVKTDFDFKTVTVSQKGQKGEDPNVTPSGSGTAADPYNVAAALQKAQSLVAYNNGDDLGIQNSATVYTKGKVVSVEVDPSYGNASYFISADGTAETQLEVYRGKYLNGDNFLLADQLKVGDEVVVYGTLVNFKGSTPEYTAGSKLISINGSTEPAKIDFTKFELITVQAFIDKADKAHFYRLKGTVSRFNKEYCSFDLTDDSGKIYVYSVNNKDEWVDKIKNGGTVELAGLYTYYEKNSQHEVVSAQILSFEGGSDTPSGDPKGTGTLEDPYNPAGAAAAVKDLTWTANDNYETTDVVYVKGKICKIANKGSFTDGGTFGNASFFISEDGTGEGEFQVYRTLYLGNKKFEEGQTDIKVGDEVIICGKLMNYKGNTPETEANNSYLYSLNGVTGGDDPGPGGEVTEATVAEAIVAEKDAILKVGPAVVVASSDAGFLMEQEGVMIYVYGGKAVVGDNVTVEATRAEYQGVPQLSSPKVTVNASGVKVTYPAAKDISSGFDTYSSDSREFITYKGKLSISDGKYFNIMVDGAEEVKGSIVKPVEDISSFDGKDVTIKGYYLYHNTTKSGDTYLYVIATEINDIKITGNGGNESGNTEKVDFSTQGYENAVDVTSFKGTNFTISIEKGTNKNGPKYYTSGSAVRCYGGNILTVSSSKTITQIKFTFSSGEGTNEITADKGSFSNDTWTGSASSVKFTVGGTSGHRRIKVITVTFAE